MGTKNINNRSFYIFSFIAIICISFVILFSSFNLAFEDEEWQGIVLPKTTYVHYVTNKLTAYSSPMWFMTNIYTWIGPNFTTYFTLSFILRDFVSFGVLIFLYILTKNRLASFLGGMLIAVGFSGIQTTYEVINMISYISYIGILIFLCSFLLSHEEFKFRYLPIMAVSLLLSTILASFRTYPFFAWIFMIDTIKLLINFRKKAFNAFFLRQAILTGVFLLLYKVGIFSWYSRDAVAGQQVNDLTKFMTDILSLFSSLNFNVMVNYLRGLGGIIIPDILDKSNNATILVGAFYIIFFITLLVYALKKRLSDKFWLLAFLSWPFVFYTSYFLVYINGFAVKDSAIFHSNIRYQFPPFIGFSIALFILFSTMLKDRNRHKSIIIIISLIFISIHALTTNHFLNELSKIRDGSYMVSIWKQINYLVPESRLSSEKINTFYFETDGSERAIYTVNDGFIGHAIALYKIDSKPQKYNSVEIGNFGKLLAPPIISYDGLLLYIKENLINSSEDDIWDRIFALKVEGGRVREIKDEIRKKVEVSLGK